MPHVHALIGRPRHDVTSSDVHRLLRSAWETVLRGEMIPINEITCSLPWSHEQHLLLHLGSLPRNIHKARMQSCQACRDSCVGCYRKPGAMQAKRLTFGR